MDTDTSAFATASEPSNPVPMEVGQPSSSTDLNVVTVAVAAPAWLTALKLDIYFQECSDVTAWQLLVQSLYKFEEGNTINGVCRYCSTTSFLTNPLPVEFTDYFSSR
jgi:hypothetical protein